MMKSVVAVVLLLLSPVLLIAQEANPAVQPGANAPSSPAAQSGAAEPRGPAPAANQTGADETKSAPQDYSQQAYVVEHYLQSMRFEGDGTGRQETKAQIKIISESGVQALGQLKVGYSALSEKLEIGYVRVVKPDGTVITAQESAVQDLTFADAPVYSDYHEKHISVPSLRPGDVLEYDFIHTITEPLTPGEFWGSYNFAEKGIVLDEQLIVDVPKERQIKLKTKPGYDPVIKEEGDRRIYTWTHSHLKDDDEAKKKATTPKEDEVPSVEFTTYKTWEQVGTWYANLERERRVPDASVKAEAATLVKGKSSDMAKVKALYDYVSGNIRYVSLNFGLGRIQPHAASEVLANGYGDCKDKNTLLAAMLDAEGFHSTSVLIGSSRKLDPDIPSPMQFDHVITRVPVDGQEIWLDSTPGVAPFRMLSMQLRGKQALAIIPDNKSELVWTPTELPFQAFDRTVVSGSVSDSGKVTVHVTLISRGDTEMLMRYALRRMPSSRWKDFFDHMLARTRLAGAEVTNVKSTDPSDTDNPLQVDFDVASYNYFDWSAAESKFSLPLSTIVLPSVNDDDDSTEPIKLAVIQNQAEVKLAFPPKYQLHVPINVDIKRDYANYHSAYAYAGGTFTSLRTVNVLVRELSRSRADDYAAFRRVVLADESQDLTVENQSPSANGLAGSDSADDLNKAGVQALNNEKYQLALDLFQQALKIDPKQKSAWNNLGRTYLRLGQPEKAIAALEKQVELNAYDEFAYNNLGLAYEQLARWDDAARQFQKQIEINPLDAYAHANIGGLYLEQKKYAAAVPELEKAVDLQPKNTVMLINLGQAYIGNNQTAKGMASFEKAIAISATPLVWNNIAYSLSEQNVQLDRATQYADTAINALQTQLGDVTLANLRMQDLGAAQLLFAVWDTKGWVEFKRGNNDVAEQYVRAAWLAGGTGDEAEHLGEIYEKEGKREQAIRYYVLSLVAENASQQARGRLTALGVKDKDIDARMKQLTPELQRERTVPLNTTGKGSAEYFLLVSPSKVEDVKLIKGDEGVKDAADAIHRLNAAMPFPPDAKGHVVRRAKVQCGAAAPGPCTLEMVPSSEVRTLD